MVTSLSIPLQMCTAYRADGTSSNLEDGFAQEENQQMLSLCPQAFCHNTIAHPLAPTTFVEMRLTQGETKRTSLFSKGLASWVLSQTLG